MPLRQHHILSWTGRAWLPWVLTIVAIFGIGLVLSWLYWSDLHGVNDVRSTTIRNLGLVIGGTMAMVLAIWRSIVAERQAETAQGSLHNERYQKGAEMLGSVVLAVRLGGIYALQRLAQGA